MGRRGDEWEGMVRSVDPTKENAWGCSAKRNLQRLLVTERGVFNGQFAVGHGGFDELALADAVGGDFEPLDGAGAVGNIAGGPPVAAIEVAEDVRAGKVIARLFVEELRDFGGAIGLGVFGCSSRSDADRTRLFHKGALPKDRPKTHESQWHQLMQRQERTWEVIGGLYAD